MTNLVYKDGKITGVSESPSLIEQVEEWRRTRGFSMAQMARFFNVTWETYKLWAQSKAVPRSKKIQEQMRSLLK